MSVTRLAACLALFVMGAAADTVHVTVVGTSDPWLAGMPTGSTASTNDSAPGQSPVLVPISLIPGTSLMFSATGGVLNYSGCDPLNPASCFGADGGSFYSHDAGAQNGISNVVAPINALMGVFLDGNQPDLTAAPAALDFGAIGIDFASLAPGLKQVFFIGNGITSTAVQQSFIVPVGATRLYLGTMDGFEWNNNSGAFEAAVTTPSAVPEPGSYLLFATIVAGFALRRRFGPAR